MSDSDKSFEQQCAEHLLVRIENLSNAEILADELADALETVPDVQSLWLQVRKISDTIELKNKQSEKKLLDLAVEALNKRMESK